MLKQLRFTLLAVSMLPAATLAAAPTAWLLSYEGKSTNEVAWDKRTVELVRTRVPAPLSEQVLRGLGGPPDPVFVSEHRYAGISACVPHDCGDKGFLWVDTKTGVGLGAAFGYGDKLTIGSNGLSAAAIPPPARRVLMDWITEQQLHPATVDFIGASAGPLPLNAADFQPRPQYQPPAGGPSFDCGSRLNAVETSICGDSELKALDRDVGELFERVRRGNTTAGARAQLREFQRTWLKNRNASCAHAAPMRGCLVREYEAQQERLSNWVPSK